MRPFVIFSVLCLLAYTAAHARIAIAPVIGVSSAGAKVGTTNPASLSPLSSFKAGLHIEKKVTPHFYLSPGVYYSVYGYRRNVTGVDVQYRYNTVELPLYFLLKTGRPCKPRLVLGAGVLALATVGNVMVANGNSSQFAGGKAGDVGAGLYGGIEFPKGLFLYGTYQATKSSNVENRGSMFQYSMGIGYLFGKVRRSCPYER